MSDKLRQQLIARFGETGWGENLPEKQGDEPVTWLEADDPRTGPKHQPIQKTIDELAMLGVKIHVGKEN